jgi:hypothetical protein
VAEEGEDDLVLDHVDAGYAFRSEMAATNFLLGYWVYLVAAVVIILGSILFWGQWQNMVQRGQRGATGQIAEVEATLPGALPDLPRLMANPVTAVTPEELTTAAKSLEAIGADAGRTASVEAYLKAAELYRLAESPDDQRRALEHAAAGSTGTLHYAAEAALANLDLEQDNGDQSVSRLQSLTEGEGYLAQQAMLDLALTLEHLDRKGEANTTYAQFMERWPDSKLIDEVKARQGRLEIE